MKKVSLSLARLMLKLLCVLGILATFWIICEGAFFPEMRAILPLSVYIAVGIFSCSFLAVVTHRARFRQNYSNLLLIFWLRHDLFENTATTLQGISADYSAMYPAVKSADHESVSNLSEDISITFDGGQEETRCKSLAAQLQPFFSFFKEFNEKIYEPAAENSVFRIELKAAPTGCQFRIWLDSHEKWTLFYIPSQNPRHIETYCFYSLKPIDNGWYIGVRG